ncbi:ribulose 1,5-bisphosphate carboxylase [Candidatus Heimdallarchaeota archaeon]|nr:MAG: ribulose 1,5-bisphosphate carboxylase [Candidatus Heimdallarchaeota archaeon]
MTTEQYKELLVARYYVEHVKSVDVAAEEICDEESVGTWTDLKTTEGKPHVDKLRAEVLDKKVFETHDDYQSGEVTIGFQLDTFDMEAGITSILSMLAGNLFGLGALRNIRWLDVEFPRSIAEHFPGPKFGIEGVRKILGTDKGEFPNRPHVGTIVKPKMGLTAKEWAEVAYEAAIGGVDFIKDDENLSNQPFCPIEDRTVAVLEKMDLVKEETGRKVIHAVNVTAKHDVMWRRIEQAIDNGAQCLMIDVILTGYQELAQMASDPGVKLPIHVHRTMHAAFTRNPLHGISMLPVAKIVRLAGGDQLHIGSYGQGKMAEIHSESHLLKNSLLSDMYEFNKVFPVASGGLYPAKVPNLVKHGGNNVIIQAGGGIHGHPDGTRKGAMAMKQALDATLKDISLDEYAKDHVELAKALELWGK